MMGGDGKSVMTGDCRMTLVSLVSLDSLREAGDYHIGCHRCHRYKDWKRPKRKGQKKYLKSS